MQVTWIRIRRFTDTPDSCYLVYGSDSLRITWVTDPGSPSQNRCRSIRIRGITDQNAPFLPSFEDANSNAHQHSRRASPELENSQPSQTEIAQRPNPKSHQFQSEFSQLPVTPRSLVTDLRSCSAHVIVALGKSPHAVPRPIPRIDRALFQGSVCVCGACSIHLHK